MNQIHYSPDELYHYGVFGMKWGVRRAKKKLSSATNKDQYTRAVNKLNTHKSKSEKKVSKLTNRINKMAKQSERDESSRRYEAATLSRKAAKLRKKSHGIIRIKSLDGIREFRASRLDNKSQRIKLSIEKTRKDLLKSESTRKIFEQGIQDIDKTLIENGKRILSN